MINNRIIVRVYKNPAGVVAAVAICNGNAATK
jgi:hypothetical protein